MNLIKSEVAKDDDDRSSSKNTVMSLAKGFRILEAFTAAQPELTMAEVARRSGIDNATAFRFLNTLVNLGYVEKVADTRLFRLSFKVLDLGFNAIAHSDLRTNARPILRSLVGEVREVASIGVLEGSEVLYAERVQAGLTRLGVDIRIGSRVPVYSSAIGHAILAWCPKEFQIQVLKGAPRKQLTATTLVDLDELIQRLEEVRAQGYAVSNQETVSGLYVVAAPILDIDGVPLAALSVATPAFNTTLNQFKSDAIIPVMDAASKLSKALQTNGGFTLSNHS
ncbi:IclR family transcriptional regulator [Paralcaligenes ureilyticus]|uniref:IclR family transcriptional regulator n=1 Tax=Paralcaligenes ureilyticus TaxID=627131 RepID=A0A4R3M7N6_9BURK|nr:IclR family transcriptional regulator [Paralcaligenes ureilyticus]TCT09501.1 IclR family transcriptional regulator [Paralcaligenes ureilyticus]